MIETLEISRTLVQVRVFNKGLPVKNLGKNDFRLLENGQEQTIEDLFRKTGRIKYQGITLNTHRGKKIISPRYIVLVFSITDFTSALEEGIDYFFDSILQEKDELLIFANNQTMFFSSVEPEEIRIRDVVKETLKDQAAKAEKEITQYIVKMEQRLNIREFNKMIEQEANYNFFYIIDFFSRYLRNWVEFKKQFLMPDLDTYYNFAHHLEKINREKWIINFFQFDQFPRLDISTAARINLEAFINRYTTNMRGSSARNAITLRNILDQIRQEMNLKTDYPILELNKLFYKINATFHTIFIKGQKKGASKNPDFNKVSSLLGDCMMSLSRNTGGRLIITDDVSSALEEIGSWETFYYLLSYRPESKIKNPRIEIRVSNPDYRVVYDDRVRADYITEFIENRTRPAVRLRDLHYSGTSLAMKIEEYFLPEIRGKPSGRVQVKVLVKDRHNREVYQNVKYITARKKNISLSIDFAWLKKGKYFFVVEVTDMLTRKSALNFLEVQKPAKH